jgi:transcriptional regulator with XRE-family HTH domain
LCGLAGSHIARIEKGRYSVGFDTLQTIAEALGYDVDFTKKQ